MALQIHRTDPRTTVDIDVAVESLDRLPRDELLAARFRHTGTFEHSESWMGPQGVPVQFTGDPELAGPVQRSLRVEFDGLPLRVLSKPDLLQVKVRAGADPAPRRSKRLQDPADAEGLIEEMPKPAAEPTDAERRILESPPGRPIGS